MSGTIPNLSDHIEMGVFEVFQIPYSALQREHEDLIIGRGGNRRRDSHPGWRRSGRPG